MKCALSGNQNSGKSLLFNDLTGLNQKVGNWAGVTVDKKIGRIKKTDIEIIDLPGVYSLSPYTSEEEVTREFIVEENPDLIINIIDSTSIERSLYLTTQLMELGKDLIIVLNMEDILKKRGYKIDVEKLSKMLGVTVVSISALKKTGINKLISIIKEKKYKSFKEYKIFDEKIEDAIKKIIDVCHLSNDEARFDAVKILERDVRYIEFLNTCSKVEPIIEEIEKEYNDDTEELIATKRYEFIETLRNTVFFKTNVKSLTSKIDKVVLNKYAAIPIFILIMLVVFTLSVGIVGGITSPLIDAFFNGSDGKIPLSIFGLEVGQVASDFKGLGNILEELIVSSNGSPWAVSLVKDGIIAGVGAVLNFIPQLLTLFLLLSLLETSGYMARITFLFDHFFRKIGLSGKSLIPFIVGVGCTVPAIMNSRTIEEKNEHKMTIILTPFIPCNAKLPIISCICGAFFGKFSLLVTICMYLLAILMIIVVGLILHKFNLKTKKSSYLIELPEYHLPSATYVLKDTLNKTWDYLKRAGTIILLASIIIWFLASFSYNFTYIEYSNGWKDEAHTIRAPYSIDDSLLAWIGRCLSWIFYPMVGIGHSYNEIWGISVSSIQGLVAKEQVIASMQVIAKVGDNSSIFNSAMFSYLNPVTGFAFMSFNLFCAPCFGSMGAMKKELGSFKEMFKTIGIETGFSWVLATLIGIVGGILGVVGVF